MLSIQLASTTQYPTYNPDHLDAAKRLPMVLDKLEEEMKAHQNLVIALQEVSYDWAGPLHAFFAQNGYHLVTGLYGKPFNGYMGVCLAWPTQRFDVLEVDISRLSDKREEGWPDDEEPPSLPRRLFSGLQSVFDKSLRTIGLIEAAEETIDHWKLAERRFNVLVAAKLEEKQTKRSFWVANYHMPCAFYAPMVMTIHCDLAARHVQLLAKDSPYIFAGDFNIKPCDPTYRFLTTGEIDKDDPFFPTPKSGMEWKPTSESVSSAYATKTGREPDFTNYARALENEPFIDTLDYIFLDKKNWEVIDVRPAKHRDESGGPFPNLEEGEPSDHVMIAADLGLC